jgi:hypothetical protein
MPLRHYTITPLCHYASTAITPLRQYGHYAITTLCQYIHYASTPVRPLRHYANMPLCHYASTAIMPLCQYGHYTITPVRPLRQYASTAIMPVRQYSHYAITPVRPLRQYASTAITPLRQYGHSTIHHSLASVKDMYVEMGFPLNLYRHSLSKLYSKHWTDTRSKQEKCAYQPMILDQRYSNVGLARPLVNVSPSCSEVSIFKSLIPRLLISS